MMAKRLSLIVALLACGVTVRAATDTRVPTGDGLTGFWTASSGGSFFADVDDPVGAADNDTTYLSGPVPADLATFTFAAFSLPAGSTVSAVDIVATGKTSGDGLLKLALRIGGGHYYLSTAAITGSYVEYSVSHTVNPATGIAWVQADVEGTGANPLERFGVTDDGTHTSGAIRVTQIYLKVTYTTAGGPPIGTLQLLGVGR